MDVTMADDAEGGAGPAIFEEVFFSIIPSDHFSPEDQDSTRRQLLLGGATEIALKSPSRLSDDLARITHVIATTADFPDFLDARDRLINVVRPRWVTDSMHKNKTPNPRQYSPDPAMIFADITLVCSGLPEGDTEAIRGLILGAGGMYSSKITKAVTHIVTLDMDNDAVQFAVRKQLQCRFVLPHWLDDCLKIRRRINEGPYLLPDPPILRAELDRDQFDPVDVDIPMPQLKGATEPHPSRKLKNAKDLSVFSEMEVYFCDDLGLSEHLLQTLESMVKRGGGKVAQRAKDANTLICRFRESAEFAQAYAERKDIGNLAWLYYLISYNKWTMPSKRLLHFPVPRNGFPGFENTQISITIYTGEARTYLENLVLAAGGNFTRTLREDNTHLIAAHTKSEKCEAAMEWNQVNVVNHLWLEESFASGIMRPTSNRRYTTFPARTNLGEVIGQTQIDTTELDAQYRTAPPKDTTSAGRDVKVTSRPAPTENKAKPQLEKTRTPAVSRFSDGKENETPGTTGSRGAKTRAISSLKDAAKDIEQYQRESKRVGGVTHGGTRPREHVDRKPKKRSSPEPVESEDDDDDTEPQLKKSKTGPKLPAIAQRLMVTKYEKWLEQPDQEAKDKNKLRNLGIHVTENSSECTILCAPKIVRTKKFVTALASAPLVVNTDWLDACIKNNKIPPGNTHLLDDKEQEQKFEINLRDSLKRAVKNKHKLLRDWQIFCTENIQGGFQTFSDIVKANGGVCSLYRGRSYVNASKRQVSNETQEDRDIASNQGEDEGNTLFLLSTESKQDKQLWPRFRELACKEDMLPKIVASDWLLQVTMSQQVLPAGKWELLG